MSADVLLDKAYKAAKEAHAEAKRGLKSDLKNVDATLVIETLVAWLQEDISMEEAVEVLAADFGREAIVDYADILTHSFVMKSLANAPDKMFENISKDEYADHIVATAVRIGEIVVAYMKGDLTPSQCLIELGNDGWRELGGATFAAMAGSLASSTAASAAVKTLMTTAGAEFGYVAAAYVYDELVTSLQEYEYAVEQRIIIEQECADAVELICRYREEMNMQAEKYLFEHQSFIAEGFRAMDRAITSNDTNGFIAGNAIIQERLGHIVQFRTQEEFDDLMASEEAFVL